MAFSFQCLYSCSDVNGFIVTQLLPTAMTRVEEDGSNVALGDVTYPIERGMIKDWDAMEDLWRYVFYTSLGWEPGSEGQLLVAEPLLSPKVCFSPSFNLILFLVASMLQDPKIEFCFCI